MRKIREEREDRRQISSRSVSSRILHTAVQSISTERISLKQMHRYCYTAY